VFKAGEIIKADQVPTHYVYALIDEADQVFYIGVTTDPPTRLRQHVYRPGNTLMTAKLLTCQPRLLVLSVHAERQEAETEERRQISANVALLNFVGTPRMVALGVKHNQRGLAQFRRAQEKR
jgi:predicted GIY-YIG superfamily endonuclease